jgi:hypothetical protein
LVRWFRNTLRGSGLEFGCELLSDQPQAAAASAEGGPTAALLPAVVLPEDGQDASPPTVLVPAGAFQLEHAISLTRGDGTETAVLTKLVEQGPGFELYEFVAVS